MTNTTRKPKVVRKERVAKRARPPQQRVVPRRDESARAGAMDGVAMTAAVAAGCVVDRVLRTRKSGWVVAGAFFAVYQEWKEIRARRGVREVVE